MSFKQFLIEMPVIAASMKAHNQLSDEAKRVIAEWETSNWDNGDLVRHVKANDKIAKEIEAVFAPVRASIKSSKIRLYRGLQFVDGETFDASKKYLESWSLTKEVAEYFAGLRSQQNKEGASLIHKEVTDAEIEKAVSVFNRSGFVTFRGKKYRRNKDLPQYYDIFNSNGAYLTDGDDIESEFRDVQEYITSVNAEKNRKAKIIVKDVDVKDIIWISNRLGSKEFIVRRQK